MQTNIPFRPMRLMEILDAAFRLYRRNFWGFMAVAVVFSLPLQILQAVMVYLQQMIQTQSRSIPSEIDLGLYITLFAVFILVSIVTGVLSQLGLAVLTRFTASASLGHKVSVSESYRAFGERHLWWRVILFSIFLGLLNIVALLWMLVPCVGWLTGPGFLLVFSAMISPIGLIALTVEQQGVIASVRRAWELVRNRLWWFAGVAGALSLLGLVISGPSSILTIAQRGLSPAISLTGASSVFSTLIDLLIGFVVSMLYLPLNSSVMFLAYADTRVRSEGLDVVIEAQQVENEPLTIEAFEHAPRAELKQPIIITDEVFALVGLTFIFAILYAVLVGGMMGVMGLFF